MTLMSETACARGAGLELRVIGGPRDLLAVADERLLDAGSQVRELSIQPLLGLCLGGIDLGVERLDLSGHGLAQCGQRVLRDVALLGHDLAGGREDDVLGDRLAGALQRRLDLLGGGGQLLGTRGESLVLAAAIGIEGPLHLRLLVGDRLLELGLAGVQRFAGARDARLHLLVDADQRLLALALVHAAHDVHGEVEDALQVARADVEQDAQPRRRALEVPDVAHRGGELDVAHPLAAHLGAGDLHATLVADDPLVADPLVLAAVALPVLGGPEDALVEETVLLRLERAVVDRLRLGDLPADQPLI